MNAIIFPGQGSQYTGMGKSFYDNFPQARDIFSSIDEILGFKLSKKCFEAEAFELKQTSLQQLAILAVSLAAFEVFKGKNVKIDYLSGLSLGEYSCLYAGGAISLDDLAILVKERAYAMQKAAQENPSTMLAVIGADRIYLEQKQKEENFYIANLNSQKQTVLSVAKDKVSKVKELLEKDNLNVIELEVSGGFHSPFMSKAKDHLVRVIDNMEFSDSKIPIVSNFTAKAHTRADQIKSNLLNQLVSAVLWHGCVELMTAEGITTFFEVGPSRVLRGLMRKINPQLKVVNIEKAQDLENI